MKTARPRIVEYLNTWRTADGKSVSQKRWKISGLYIDGQRTRKFFQTKKEAEAWLHQKLAQKDREGWEGLKISDDLRIMASNCSKDLEPYGMSLRDAVNDFIQRQKAIHKSIDLEPLFTEFISSKQKDGLRPKSIADLRNRVARFVGDFSKRNAAEIHSREIDDWLRKIPGSGLNRNNTRRCLGSFFEYAKGRGYCESNPVEKTSKAKQSIGIPRIFTSAESHALLKAAQSCAPEWLPTLAIGLFAGLRPNEIERLDWKEIDLQQNIIMVTADKSKTATRRVVKIENNLHQWLSLSLLKKGSVHPSNARKAREACMEVAKIKEWSQDVLRHTYASHHIAHFKDPIRLALEMGHSNQTMIHKHYKALVTPQEGENYWHLKPKLRNSLKRNPAGFL